MKVYYVYNITNYSKTLYVGISYDIAGRIYQHKQGIGSKFTTKYKINQLVYYETYGDVHEAIAREKQIKVWLRRKKVEQFESKNPFWEDWSAGW